MHHVEFAGVTHRAHVGVHLRRQVRHLRARARRRRPGAVPGDVEPREPHALLRRRSSRARSRGRYVQERPQTDLENCTWHNCNVVPLRNKDGKPRYVLVAGNYQSGISVVDFTDPANAKEIAYADPPPLVDPNPPASSSAATGRPTGTTAASTSPTSRGACSSGASTTRAVGPVPAHAASRTRRRGLHDPSNYDLRGTTTSTSTTLEGGRRKAASLVPDSGLTADGLARLNCAKQAERGSGREGIASHATIGIVGRALLVACRPSV